MSVVVLVSGRGSNMQALLEAGLPVSAVISNRADAKGLAIAASHGIATRVVEHRKFPSREAFDAALAEFCAADDPARLQLLATYGTAGLRRMLIGIYETLRSAGRELVLEVNISARTMSDPEFALHVQKELTATGIEPARLIFEVTESAMAADIGRALENLSRLRVKGFGLSLDDYGTGYSSMQQLARIPFTELKIDQSFVRNAATRPSDRAMLESSLEIAQKLGIVAVAEGVESQAEWDMLREMGCGLAQGYFIAHPMGAHEFLDWLAARRIGG